MKSGSHACLMLLSLAASAVLGNDPPPAANLKTVVEPSVTERVTAIQDSQFSLSEKARRLFPFIRKGMSKAQVESVLHRYACEGTVNGKIYAFYQGYEITVTYTAEEKVIEAKRMTHD